MRKTEKTSPSGTLMDTTKIAQLFDQREYRHALGTFTTGVTIITACAHSADGAENLVGMTANSFNSVSLDPPLVLWSMSKSSSSAPVFEAAEYWAVHILSHDQDGLANRFAKRGVDKFAGLTTERGLGGAPLLPACTTRMQCKTAYRYDGGDHIIMVGEVMHFDHTDIAPLVYQRGNYAIATRKDVTDEAEALIKVATSSHLADENTITPLLGNAYFQLYAQLREFGAQQGLNDTEFFVLNTLATNEGRTSTELMQLFVYAGHSPLDQVLNDMTARGLLHMVIDQGEDSERGIFYLTALGRDVAQKIVDAGKKIEEKMLRKLKDSEAITLQMLLRRFVNPE